MMRVMLSAALVPVLGGLTPAFGNALQLRAAHAHLHFSGDVTFLRQLW